MSTHSEMPRFQFDSFSAEEVAEKVMWPLIDDVWRDDWREHSVVASDPFRYPRRGVIPDRIVVRNTLPSSEYADSVLLASTIAGEGDVDEFGVPLRESYVSLLLKLYVDADAKDAMINRAIQEEENTSEEPEESEEDEDEHAELVVVEGVNYINNYDDPGDELLAVISTEFMFDSSGGAEIARKQWLAEPDGTLVWTPSMVVDKDDSDAIGSVYSPEAFTRTDVDLIEAGLYIFKAPEAIIRALRAIKPT